MGFEIVNTFEFISVNETAPVARELKRLKKKIVMGFSHPTVYVTVTQKDNFAGKKVTVSLIEVEWYLHHNNQTNSYVATCTHEAKERKVNLDPDVGQYVYELVQGISEGEIVGETARNLVRFVFRELEIKHAPSNSWVKEHFPKLFKQEETTIERQRRKICKDVMKA